MTPRPVVSLLASATELLFAVGAGDRVAAVSHECDWPPEVRQLPRATRAHVDSSLPSHEIDAQVRRLLAAGEPLYETVPELLQRLAPEVIVAQSQCDVCAVRLADVLRLTRDLPPLAATRVVDLHPQSLDDVLRDAQRVAAAVDRIEAGERCVAQWRQRLDAVRRQVADVPHHHRPRVALVEWTEPLMLAANWMPELVALAGGHNVVTRAGEPSAYRSWDELLQAAPDVLIVAPCGFDLDRAVRETTLLAARPQWPRLPAVRAGRVVAVDGNAYFNRAGPRLVESVEILAHLLHPTRVPAPPLPHPAWQRIDGRRID